MLRGGALGERLKAREWMWRRCGAISRGPFVHLFFHLASFAQGACKFFGDASDKSTMIYNRIDRKLFIVFI